MMKYAVILTLSFALFACKSNTNNKISDDNTQSADKYAIYKYKIVGLNDTIISDSIWKMIFKVEGVEELSLNKVDSSLIIKVETAKVSRELVSSEIIARGGEIIQILQ
jgi:ribosomal protein S8E